MCSLSPLWLALRPPPLRSQTRSRRSGYADPLILISTMMTNSSNHGLSCLAFAFVKLHDSAKLPQGKPGFFSDCWVGLECVEIRVFFVGFLYYEVYFSGMLPVLVLHFSFE